MGVFRRFIHGLCSEQSILDAQREIAEGFQAADVLPHEKEIAELTFRAAIELLSLLKAKPIPNALADRFLTTPGCLEFYKVAFAYFFVVLSVEQGQVNTSLYRRLSRLVDPDADDNNSLYQELAAAYISDAGEPASVQVSRAAWARLRRNTQTYSAYSVVIQSAFAIVLAGYRPTASRLFGF